MSPRGVESSKMAMLRSEGGSASGSSRVGEGGARENVGGAGGARGVEHDGLAAEDDRCTESGRGNGGGTSMSSSSLSASSSAARGAALDQPGIDGII